MGGAAGRDQPALMPVTRMTNAAIDHVAFAMEETRADALRYASADLLAYRAEAPDSLVERQTQLWSRSLPGPKRNTAFA